MVCKLAYGMSMKNGGYRLLIGDLKKNRNVKNESMLSIRLFIIESVNQQHEINNTLFSALF
jgi:hypothetical protein